MGVQDYYQRKYSAGDFRLGINLTVCLTLTMLVFYTVAVVGMAKASIPFFAALIFAYRTYIAFVFYRTVIVFADRIQVLGIVKSDFTEVYFDNIAAIGFLGSEVTRDSRPFLLFMRNNTTFENEKLTISLKAGSSIALPQLGYNELNEILKFIQPRLTEGDPLHIGTGVIAASVVFRGRYSQVRFETGKNGIVVSAVIAIILFLIVIWSVAAAIYALTIFFGVVLFCAVYTAWSFYTDYKEILLYDDHMRIVGISGRLIREIYFSEIKNIGFLHGATHTYGINDTDGERMENMVLLMYDGSREDLTDAVSNIHQLCSIIQQKINPA